jgi:hypothetical protein
MIAMTELQERALQAMDDAFCAIRLLNGRDGAEVRGCVAGLVQEAHQLPALVRRAQSETATEALEEQVADTERQLARARAVLGHG